MFQYAALQYDGRADAKFVLVLVSYTCPELNIRYLSGLTQGTSWNIICHFHLAPAVFV